MKVMKESRATGAPSYTASPTTALTSTLVASVSNDECGFCVSKHAVNVCPWKVIINKFQLPGSGFCALGDAPDGADHNAHLSFYVDSG